MIGYLKGHVLYSDGKNILMDVGGVGYEVTVSADTATQCIKGSSVEIYTYLHVREDEMSLYGFSDQETLTFFKLLLTVSGVGPKMGIELLSLPLHRLKQAIAEEDKSFLTSIKGVGDKLASRILLELKNKVTIDFATEPSHTATVNMDVVMALEKLGYDRNKVIQLLKEMKEPLQNEEEMIKYCLRNL
jgi:Holliday junction DNA helicase RuvA